MLDKQKVMQELLKSVPTLFKDTAHERAFAQEVFTWLRQHPDVVEQIQLAESAIAIPSWQGAVDNVYTVTPHEYPYTVVAVDGSQIYPDRHQGVSCYLLNSGVAHFTYDMVSSVRLHSSPVIFTQVDTLDMSEDMVNCRRAELEFEVGLEQAIVARSLYPTLPLLFLCDGSLIFWHLESKHPRIKERFLKRYIEQLDAFFQERVVIAGFISLPKSKELVSILRKGLAYTPFQKKGVEPFETVIDTDIAQWFINPNQRTVLFIHNSSLAEAYPAHLRPCFVYMHCGDEIARIEIPFWVAQDEGLLNTALRILMDQCNKGNGYPIALAEAHEQAVVNTSDRQFFFEMLYKMAINENYRLHASQKSLKKRFVSI